MKKTEVKSKNLATNRHQPKKTSRSITTNTTKKGTDVEKVLASSMPQIYMYDDKGRYIFVSVEGAKVLGLKPMEMVGKTWQELGLPPEYMEPFEDQLEAVFDSGQPLAGENTFQTVDGEKDFEYTFNPIINTDGHVESVECAVRDITERKHAELESMESRIVANDIIETMHEPVLVLDANLEVIIANRSFYETFKATMKETEGKKLAVLGKRQWNVPKLQKLLKTVIPKNNKIENFEVEAEFPNIGKCKMRLNAQRLSKGYDNSHMVLLAIEDVTGFKHVEDELKESEEKWRSLTEYSSDNILTVDLNQNILFINNTVSGITIEETVGKSIYSFIPKEFHKSVKQCFKNVLKSGQPNKYYFDFLGPDGTNYYFEARVASMLKAGNITGFTISATDITERKQAQEKIEHFNTVLRAIRNVNQLITKEKDLDTLIANSCKQLIENRGYFNSWISLFDNEGKFKNAANAGMGKEFSQLKKRLKNGKMVTCQKIALQNDGVGLIKDTIKTCKGCPEALKHQGTGILVTRLEHEEKTFGTITLSLPEDLVTDQEEQELFKELAGDISFALHSIEIEEEHKLAEVKLKEYSENLEEMVEARTQELREAQEQLVQKEKLAVLGQLAGGVGHELRNPLGVIKNAAYFLKMAIEKPEPEVKESLRIIDQEVTTSDRIISNLLNFARTKPPMQRKVDVNDIVRKSVSQITIPKNIKVVNKLDKVLPTTLADSEQLNQIFEHIIHNAIQAMPEGGRLTIKSKMKSPEQVVVSFTDTGGGIPEENMERLFEPLFTTKAKGIGLGLVVAKSIVEGHGGVIDVQSNPGKGSTFSVRLPININVKVGEIHE